MIALDISERTGIPLLAVCQNLHIIKGKPGWGSPFMIAAINQCGKFSRLRFQLEGEGDDRGCLCTATDLGDGELLEGTRMTIGAAKRAGSLGAEGFALESDPRPDAQVPGGGVLVPGPRAGDQPGAHDGGRGSRHPAGAGRPGRRGPPAGRFRGSGRGCPGTCATALPDSVPSDEAEKPATAAGTPKTGMGPDLWGDG